MYRKGQCCVLVTNLHTIISHFFFTTGEIAVKKHKWFVDSLKHTTVVVMIDEYRTSMMCSTCGSETRKPTINELIDFPRELRKRVQRDKDRGRGLLV